MNHVELVRALDKLGLNQSSLSRLLKISLRRVAYWASGEREVPTEVAMLLNLMLDTGTSYQQLRTR
jgi:DNA-binding transcriptional regulator YiaG